MGSIPQLSIIAGPTGQLDLSTRFLHQVFESIASEHANNTALIFEGNGEPRKQTYQELEKSANRIARLVKDTIVKYNLPRNSDGDYLVGVSLKPSDTMVTVLLGIWKAGAAYLPLDDAFPSLRLEHIVKEGKPAFIVFEKDSDHYLNTHKTSIEDFLNQASNQSEIPLQEDECLQHLGDDIACVFYTSGSTGVPKGVRVVHKAILNRQRWQFKTFPYSSSERACVLKSAPTYADSYLEIWAPLLRGLTLVILPAEHTNNPENIVATLEKHQIHRLLLVPSLLRSILMYLQLQKQKRLLSHLKLWVSCGEPLAISVAKEFFQYFNDSEYKLCNSYGSTENIDASNYVISGSHELAYMEKVPIGIPPDNVIVYLLDPDFRPVKAGDVGEVFVSGMGLAAGYVNGREPDKFVTNPFATDPMFSRLYRTGDLARLEKGEMVYEGRTDSQIKIRGHKLYLTEVETTLDSISEIQTAVVLCYKPGEINQQILAFVTTRTIITAGEIEALVRKKLQAFMVPQIILIENIPLLVSGKIDRQTLLRNYENSDNGGDECYQPPAVDYSGVPPHQMDAAKTLFDTVASVLGRAARSVISMEANFYEIGGNSLNSIYTIAKLDESGYNISIGDFIDAIHLGEMLDRMTSSTHSTTESPRFTSELLKDEYKMVVLDIITKSFLHKGDLDQWLMPDISERAYAELMEILWEPLLEQNISIVAKNDAGNLVGVCLSFDARDAPEIEVVSRLAVIFEFMESIEGPVRDSQLPQGKGKLLNAFMMATHSSLTGKENVAVSKFLGDEVLKLAKERNFSGVFTTNASPLTQQLGTDIYRYQTLVDYQVNQYVASDNTKPFGLAPDSQRALVQWKPIDY